MTINSRVQLGDRPVQQIGNLVVGSNFVLCRAHHVVFLAAHLPPADARLALGVAISWFLGSVN